MSRKIGMWLVGAHGGVSTTVAIGLMALKKQLTGNCGLVSTLPQFSSLDFVDWQNVAIGGHEIRKSDCGEEARALSQGMSPIIDPKIVEACTDNLQEYSDAIRPGILWNVGDAIENLSSRDFSVKPKTAAEGIEQIKKDLSEFKDANGCDVVVVLNLASTEPDVSKDEFPNDWAGLEATLANENGKLPASSLYAIASLQLQMPFVNFTPSLANGLDAINQLAVDNSTCHMGHDGKTGETFLKSVLAPAFAARNLNIMSWVGHNIFGNMDGQILDDPTNKETKVASKGKMLEHMLGYQPQSHISIEYIKSLGDWKTAWDHIHFQGFLGTPMTMQFTWQGSDSILAAPLVLDLFRFTELAQRKGETGLLTFLSSFFKSPLGTDKHDFALQFLDLVEWANLGKS